VGQQRDGAQRRNVPPIEGVDSGKIFRIQQVILVFFLAGGDEKFCGCPIEFIADVFVVIVTAARAGGVAGIDAGVLQRRPPGGFGCSQAAVGKGLIQSVPDALTARRWRPG